MLRKEDIRPIFRILNQLGTVELSKAKMYYTETNVF